MHNANSRTYIGDDGVFETVVWQDRVNYRDAQGAWQPIDSTLVETPGGFENRANDVRVSLPRTLRAPVRVAHGSDWLTFTLDGAEGHAGVAGATATYTDALPGVTALLTATSDGLKEDLRLATASAPSSFTYTMRTSPGLSAQQHETGAIDFVDGDRVAFSLVPPTVEDAGGAVAPAVAYRLAGAPGGYTLTVAADHAWLSAPERRWPVVVDPIVDLRPASGDRHIASGSRADLNYCATTRLDLGAGGGSVYRTLLEWSNLSAVPPHANILDARLDLYMEAADNATAVPPVSLHERLRTVSDCATTWNRYETASLWTTPGGDFKATPEHTANAQPTTPGWRSWQLNRLVESWVDGSIPNRGLLLKSTDETVQNVLHYTSSESTSPNKPNLHIHWQNHVGLRPEFKYETYELNDRMSLHVNVANGNLTLRAHDVHIEGTGLDYDHVRYYESLDGWGTHWAVGWDAHPTVQTSLAVSDGAVDLVLPEDARARFDKNPDGSFASPPGSNATLVRNADQTYTLTFDRTREKYVYASDGTFTAHRDKNGNQITVQSSGGRTTSVTDTQSRVTTFTYNAAGYVGSIRDPSGRVYSYGYTGNKLITYTDPAGRVTRYDYDAAGFLSRVTTPGGRITRLTYDATGRVTSVVQVTNVGETGPTTAYTYNQANTVSTDPRNNRTTYHYDRDLRVTRVVDALGRERSAAYTANSDVSSTTDGFGKATTSSYDSRNNLTSSTAPTGARETFTYDLASPQPFVPRTSVDTQGNRTNYGYDTNGNMTEKSDGPTGQNPVRFTYNANGTPATVTDGKGTVTRFGYDARGNATSTDNPAPLGDESFTYDTLSRMATDTDGKGQTTRYEYDVLDRITKVTFHDGSTVTYTYDPDGNRTLRVDATGTASYEFDQLNRLTRQVLPSDTVTYTYDTADNLASLTDRGGTISYAYDAVNNLTVSTEPGGHQTTFAYDANQNRTQTNYPNGVGLFVTYDDSERILSIVGKRPASGEALSTRTYSYTRAGSDIDLRTSVTDGLGVTTSYGYDSLNRLVSASGGGQTFSYAYDVNGNMTSKTVNGTTTTYTYNLANQITSSGYAHDANGNLTASPAIALGYNAKDQTVTMRPAGGQTETMTYAGTNQWERDSASSSSWRYMNNQLGLGGFYNATWHEYFTRDDDGVPLEVRNPNGRFYYLLDALGSVIALTNSVGTVVTRYQYDPFGGTTQTGTDVGNRLRYTGAYWDNNGLYKMGLRFYDPATGRWTQRDPVDDPLQEAGWNQYIYVGNDPINFTDATGACPLCRIVLRKAANRAKAGARRAWNWTRPQIGRAGMRVADTRIGSRLFGHRNLHGRTGVLNTGRLRLGVSRKPNHGYVFSLRWKQRHFDFV